LLAWAPGRRPFLPRGASREEIETAFPEWTITDDEAMDVTAAPKYVRTADPSFYRLTAREGGGGPARSVR